MCTQSTRGKTDLEKKKFLYTIIQAIDMGGGNHEPLTLGVDKVYFTQNVIGETGPPGLAVLHDLAASQQLSLWKGDS